MTNPMIMQGAPPPRSARISLTNWDSPPWNRWAFQHMREIVPTTEVWRGDGPVRELPEALRDLGLLTFPFQGETLSIDSFLEGSFTDGFLILHRGERVFERYFNGMTPRSLHLSQSVAKSVTGALTGILAGEGIIDPDGLITDYLPELAKTAYRGARLRHSLDMTSGTAFNEEYTDPVSDMARIDVAAGWKPRPDSGAWQDSVFDVITTLDKLERPHGAAFAYRSVETDVIAYCLERATNQKLAALVSDRIWSRIGAEESACFTIDRAGYALADGGFNATLRDYGRFGLLILENGSAMGRQIVPAGWIEETRAADGAKFGAPYTDYFAEGGYRNQFWVEQVGRSTLLCLGVFGQMIFIAPDYDMVGVKLSTWPEFVNPERTRMAVAAMNAIGRTLIEP